MKFKKFFYKNFRDSQAFVEGIWSKSKREFEYPLKQVQDQVTHLKYLQSILLKFDNIKAPKEFYLICFFYKSLKQLIKARTKQQDQKLESQTKIVEKLFDGKTKTGLQPMLFIKKIN